MTFSRLLGLGSKDEQRDPIHVEHQLRGYQVPRLFSNPVLAREGNTSTLLPCYYGLNRFFRSTIDAKKGDDTALRHFDMNLLASTLPGGRPFCIMDFMWNELQRVMVDPDKHLPAAPYIMYMIERVTKVTFPKDHKHEPLHLRPRSGDAPPPPPRYAGATRISRTNTGPSSSAAPSYSGIPRRDRNDSFIKRALRSIFCMCKTIASKVNENCRDIQAIKAHIGLPVDAHDELPAFDDPFGMQLKPLLMSRPMSLFLASVAARLAAPLTLLAVLLPVRKYLMWMRRLKKKSPKATTSTATPTMTTTPLTMFLMSMSDASCVFHSLFGAC